MLDALRRHPHGSRPHLDGTGESEDPMEKREVEAVVRYLEDKVERHTTERPKYEDLAAFRRNVSRYSLLVFISFLRSEKVLDTCQSFRCELTRLQEVEHKAVGGTAKEAIDHLRHRLPDRAGPAERRAIDIRAILQHTFHFALRCRMFSIVWTVV